MKTSSTRASTSLVAVTGAILALSSFAMLLNSVGREFDWEKANLAPHIFFIVVGIILFSISSFVGAATGKTEDELERESFDSEESASFGDFGDGD